MDNNSYSLRYLPVFYEDLEETVSYIANELMNVKAANDLLDGIEAAIVERLPYAEAFEQYHSKKERRYPYYRIYVGNYIVYYVVIDEGDGNKVMEVRRLLYKGRNRDRII